MAWLNFSGQTPAEMSAHFAVHGPPMHINEALLRNRFQEALQHIAPGVKAFLDQKRNNDIANQLNASESAQRATPVLDSSGHMISGGGPMDAFAVQQYNSALGMPGTYRTPDLGGAAALFLRHQQQASDDKKQADQVEAAKQEQDRRYKEAQINNLNAPGTPQVPVDINGQTYPVTPDAALRHQDATRDKTKPDSFEQLDKDVFASSGAHIGDFATGSNPRIENGQFKVDIKNPDGTKKTIPLASQLYNSFLKRYNTLQGNGADNSPTPDASTPSPGSAPNLPVISTPQQAAQLPPGTKFQTPDGTIRTVPQAPQSYTPSGGAF